MTDEKTPTPAGIKPVKRVVMRTGFASQSEFIERYAQGVSGNNLFLNRPAMFPVGTRVFLEFLLEDGTPAFKAAGEVLPPPVGHESLTCFCLAEMEPVFRGVLRRMQERSQPDAAPAASGFHRQSLEQSLQAMELISEEQKEMLPAAPPPSPDGAGCSGGLVVGIDLGTTNSCCAMVKDGRAFIIPSRRGHNTIPSVVAVDPMGETVVGHAAKAQMEINPKKTIYGSKRLVGRPFDSPVVQQMRDRYHYDIVPGTDNLAAVRIDDRIMSLEEVSARILGDLRDVAQDYLGKPIERAVITVPAYYNENQRLAVRRAGAMANLKVERILNEPTAAALAYGQQRRKNQLVLVYDLGGGTFDASVVRIQGDVYEVLATGGDTFLGGVDFDAQLMDYIVIEFQLELGKLPQMERVALLRALQAAEFAKCSLSNTKETTINLPFIGTVEGRPVDLNVKVTRAKLEELVIPLVGRTLEVCDAVLGQCEVKPDQLDAVLLVGGQTRMPLVWRMISGHLGIEPHKGVHPDEAVATGAALLAESVSQCRAVTLIDVLPVSIGLGAPGGTCHRVMPAGTPVNTSRTYAMPTALQNQTDMLLPVYQGESDRVDECEYLGSVRIQGIPPGPSGSRTIEVTFSLSPECFLTVRARDREAGELAEVNLSAGQRQEEDADRPDHVDRASSVAPEQPPRTPPAASGRQPAPGATPPPAGPDPGTGKRSAASQRPPSRAARAVPRGGLFSRLMKLLGRKDRTRGA